MSKRLIPIFLVFNFCCWALAVYFGSSTFSEPFFDGYYITTGIVVCLFLILYSMSHLRLRLLMLMIVPLSYLGELIFSDLLQLYRYDIGQIPYYIPFGHAVVFASSWILSFETGIFDVVQRFKAIFIAGYIILFGIIIFGFGDTLTAAFALLFFSALWRKKFSPFYLLMGILVLYLELVGTYFGCWTWQADPGIFHTLNPPVGAISIYIGGDVLLSRLLRKCLNYRRKLLKKP